MGDDMTVGSVDHHALATQIAAVIESQLRDAGYANAGAGDILQGSTLRLEGLLSSTSGPENRRIHLGTIDLPQLLARAYIPTPPADEIEDDSLLLADDTESPGAERDTQRRSLRQRVPRSLPASSNSSDTESARRKATGGLRPITSRKRGAGQDATAEADDNSRRITDARHFPQRKKNRNEDLPLALQPTSLHKLVHGIWEQIYGGANFDLSELMDGSERDRFITDRPDGPRLLLTNGGTQTGYSEMNVFCRKITQASRCSRALEVIVQARWTECFDSRVQTLLAEHTHLSSTKAKMMALKEACRDFAWTEKEMRNKMAIWRGYKELKDVGGWAVLVFAGMGIYRFCKYRTCFTETAMQDLQKLQPRFEVAADTVHPKWRQLLTVVGESPDRKYHGHPHDWVVSQTNSPVSLRQTYLQWNPQWEFEHLDQSIIDGDSWNDIDPRGTLTAQSDSVFVCSRCNEIQSDQPEINVCHCFPNLYGGIKVASPTQVYRTPNGRNNGLIACLPFERGQAIGEFVGLITKNLRNTDVMQGQTDVGDYQIWQGRAGNHTKFVNHSCVPNSQFERFNWLGTQRIVLVSKGIEADEEITVDYSDDYWRNLDKVCLCGHPTCRYRNRQSQQPAG